MKILSPKKGVSPKKSSATSSKKGSLTKLNKGRKLIFEESQDETMELDSSEANNELLHLENIKGLFHSSKLPDILLTRENECNEIRKFIEECLKGRQRDGNSNSVYIAGVPGTGKTASVQKVKVYKKIFVFFLYI